MHWYYSTGQDPVGPHSRDDIETLLHAGELTADTLVWRKGLADWVALADTEEFAPLLAAAAPPPVPPLRWQATRHHADDLRGGDHRGDDRPGGDHRGDHELLVGDRVAVGRRDDGLSDDTHSYHYRPGDELSADEARGDRALPHGLTAANVAPVLAGPWTRFFARSIDLTIILLLLPTAIYLGLRLTAPSLAEGFLALDASTRLLPLLPLAIISNAIIITLFGNSLGKAIFAIRAEPIEFSFARFGWGANLMRECRVWIQGMALGIPLVSFFTMVPAFRAVLRGAPTSYDLGRATVRAYSPSRLRRALGMLFALALYAGVAALSIMERVIEQPPAQLVTWTNPITGLATAIPAGWQYDLTSSSYGTPLHAFTQRETGLVALIAVEAGPDMDMATYLRALTQAMSASTTLGNWSMSPHPGTWTASGQVTGHGYPTTIYTTQNGTQFWRIMYVDQLSTQPRVIAEPALTEALLRSAGVGAAQ